MKFIVLHDLCLAQKMLLGGNNWIVKDHFRYIAEIRQNYCKWVDGHSSGSFVEY